MADTLKNCFETLEKQHPYPTFPFSRLRRDSILFERIKKVFAQRGVIKDCAMRVKKFLFDFILLPAKWIKTARQWVLKIFTVRLASGENGIGRNPPAGGHIYSVIQNQKEKPEPSGAMPIARKKELKKVICSEEGASSKAQLLLKSTYIQNIRQSKP